MFKKLTLEQIIDRIQNKGSFADDFLYEASDFSPVFAEMLKNDQQFMNY